MLSRVTRFGAVAAALLLLSACPPAGGLVEVPVDAGADVDSGTVASTPCSRPEDCKLSGLDAVCRSGSCQTAVPCEDDIECGIGEACTGGACHFTGCTRNADCGTGRCNFDSYSCAECGTAADCPFDRPVCNGTGTCVTCSTDAQCPVPGPGYCDTTTGSCVHCKADGDCPSGLSCERGVCVGAQENEACPNGVECAQDLICVTVGTQGQKCLKSCNLYTPSCPANQLCLKLTFSGSPSLVFEQGAPIGVCSPPLQGLKFYRESCSNTAACQPNLQCVQDSATASSCKAFCDPVAPSCAAGEICHPYSGDYGGRQYGLCQADSGVGDSCAKELDCRSGLNCGPAPDPVNDVATQCRFGATAAQAGLAPCTQDGQCKSGFCANDVTVNNSKFFCFTACDADSDCSIGSRTGYCDNTSNITIPPYDPTTLQGCRPQCHSESECKGYNANFTCRLVPVVTTTVSKARATCALPVGAGGPGASCTINSDCVSNYCWRRDSRGQFRSGICTAPCTGASDCGTTLSDGGTSGLPSCLPTALNVSAGTDGLVNTADDRDAVSQLCAPPSCTADEQCPLSFPRCTADSDPASTATGIVLRCRSNGLGAKTGGAGCTSDSECLSGACAELVPPAVGTGRVCLQPCDTTTTTCDPGLTCRANAARLLSKDGTAALFTACVP